MLDAHGIERLHVDSSLRGSEVWETLGVEIDDGLATVPVGELMAGPAALRVIQKYVVRERNGRVNGKEI